MSRGKAVVLDLETTGLNPRTDKIIEIGALLVEDGEILDTFSTFVSPGRKLWSDRVNRGDRDGLAESPAKGICGGWKAGGGLEDRSGQHDKRLCDRRQ